MQEERIVIREKTLKYWLVGPLIAPGADRFWKLHGYTRRRRTAMYWTLAIVLVGGGLIAWVSAHFADLSVLKAKMQLPQPVWILLPGVGTYVLLRVLLLPAGLYGAWIAARTRRAGGRICWECGNELGEGDNGTCVCGEKWNAEEVRRFWIASGLLPAAVRELRAARFAIGGESGAAESAVKHVDTRGFAVARIFTPLPRDQMTAWQERPLTQGLLRGAMRMSAGLSLLPFFGLVLATFLLSRTMMKGSFAIFIGGMVVLAVAAIIGQIALMRWSLSRTVRKTRERVRDANGLVCTDCGFALRGLDEADRCPECGIEFRAHELRGFFRASGILNDGEPRTDRK